MTNPKIEKVKTEIEKAKAKFAEIQAKLRELEREKTRLENEEIVALVRGGDPDALARLNEFITDAELYTLKKPNAAKQSEIKASEPITVKEGTENANIAEN